MNIIRFCKNWTLPIAMLSGVVLYFVYVNVPWFLTTREVVGQLVDVIQPVLIFTMLFLTFCKVDFSELRFCRWHLWLLLIQGGSFALLGMLLVLLPDFPARIIMEGGMLCLICPTATAAAVVTRKLGGDAGILRRIRYSLIYWPLFSYRFYYRQYILSQALALSALSA